MRYFQIRETDIANCQGIHVSLFVQGCEFYCKGCFNSNTWSFNEGKEWNEEVENQFIKLIKRPFIDGVTILGGEPLHLKNADDVSKLVNRIKKELPNKAIWIYTGYIFEELNPTQREIVNQIDILIDGQFKEELKDLTLTWRGSKNQRVIQVQQSLKQNKVVLYDI